MNAVSDRMLELHCVGIDAVKAHTAKFVAWTGEARQSPVRVLCSSYFGGSNLSDGRLGRGLPGGLACGIGVSPILLSMTWALGLIQCQWQAYIPAARQDKDRRCSVLLYNDVMALLLGHRQPSLII